MRVPAKINYFRGQYLILNVHNFVKIYYDTQFPKQSYIVYTNGGARRLDPFVGYGYKIQYLLAQLHNDTVTIITNLPCVYLRSVGTY
jgi:hypothetical protein